jgi:hypothetical protein
MRKGGWRVVTFPHRETFPHCEQLGQASPIMSAAIGGIGDALPPGIAALILGLAEKFIQSAGTDRIVRKDVLLKHWQIWAAILIVWTVGLEFPVWEPDDIPAREFVLTLKFIVGKTLHLCMYAVLAAMATWLPIPARFRWLMMYFLMAHAWATEMLQQLLHPWFKRGGNLEDVGIDILGIAIGVALTWKRWTA